MTNQTSNQDQLLDKVKISFKQIIKNNSLVNATIW